MDNNSFLKININLSDLDKSLINEFNGKKYLCCEAHPLRDGVDKYGNSHSIYIRVKDENGTYHNEYIGKAKTATFNPMQQGTSPESQAVRTYGQMPSYGQRPAPMPPAQPMETVDVEDPDDGLPF